MNILKKIDKAAVMWEKTKDPQYKELWYKLIKEFANGTYNFKRWTISINTSDKKNNGGHYNYR
tara:strand:+ start:647 stop:835 length:189 start_codon:yes stop_codon:yes gene_type:complete